MKFVLCVVLLALSGGIAFGEPVQDRVVKLSFTSKERKRSYYLHAPSRLSFSSGVPLVVALHGSNQNGKFMIDRWKSLSAREGFIVVAPDAADDEGWFAPLDGPDFLNDVVEHVRASYPIEPRKVYLFGHSGGAIFSIYMSLYESEFFAATSAHAGCVEVNRDIALIPYARRKIPFLLLVGTRDPLFPLSDVRQTRDFLALHGFPVDLVEIKGHDHDYEDRAELINQKAWEFFRQHELSRRPIFRRYRF